MPRRYYPKEQVFEKGRHRAFTRSACQARFRGEAWELTIQDWIAFYPDPAAWALRGRGSDDFVLTRFDDIAPWSKKNCFLISRHYFHKIGGKKRLGQDYQHLLIDIITIK